MHRLRPPTTPVAEPARRTVARRAAASAAVGTTLLLLPACGADDGTPEAAAPSHQGPSTTAPTGASATDRSATPRVSGVYFVEDTRTGVRLAREQRDLPAADPVKAAVEAMIAGPEDQDYRSTWNPGTRVLSVAGSGRVLTVDVSAAARRVQVAAETAHRMLQQLVYTVTEAAGRPEAAVRLLVGGQPAGDLWGTVSWTKPVARADPAQVRVLVQIDTPREDATTGSTVRVSGEADAFEANVPWQVLDEDGTVVKKGAATALEGMTFSPYSFAVRLTPGTYTVRVAEDDPSGGEGGTPMSDTKRIAVE